MLPSLFLLATPTSAQIGIEDILNGAFGGAFGGGGGGGASFEFHTGGGMPGGIPFGFGGGGGRPRKQQQQPDPGFPKGVEDKIAKEFNWLKGTQWFWDRWNDVKFQKDGEFEAPTQSCQIPGRCRWAAYYHNGKPKIFIKWGADGLHVMDIEGEFPTTQTPESLMSVELVGYRAKDNKIESRNKVPCSAQFDKIVDHTAFKDSIDLYDVLGLGEKDADEVSASDIKKAYRKLSLTYHPDKNSDPEMLAIYQDINLAYEILSDPGKRTRYNVGGMDMVKGEAQQGQPMEKTINVGLEELYTGRSREDTVNVRMICRKCRSDPKHPKCLACGKCPNEVKMVLQQVGPGMVIQQQQEVPSKDKCTRKSTSLDTEIVRGMKDGDTIKFDNAADQTPGQLPGDVIFKVKQMPHPVFTRNGKNLSMTMKLSLREALLGFEREIKHLDGHIVKISSNKPTKHGQIFKVNDEGMPHKDDPTRFGHLSVAADIVMPKSLTSAQKKLVEQLFPEESHRQEL